MAQSRLWREDALMDLQRSINSILHHTSSGTVRPRRIFVESTSSGGFDHAFRLTTRDDSGSGSGTSSGKFHIKGGLVYGYNVKQTIPDQDISSSTSPGFCYLKVIPNKADHTFSASIIMGASHQYYEAGNYFFPLAQAAGSNITQLTFDNIMTPLHPIPELVISSTLTPLLRIRDGEGFEKILELQTGATGPDQNVMLSFNNGVLEWRLLNVDPSLSALMRMEYGSRSASLALPSSAPEDGVLHSGGDHVYWVADESSSSGTSSSSGGTSSSSGGSSSSSGGSSSSGSSSSSSGGSSSSSQEEHDFEVNKVYEFWTCPYFYEDKRDLDPETQSHLANSLVYNGYRVTYDSWPPVQWRTQEFRDDEGHFMYGQVGWIAVYSNDHHNPRYYEETWFPRWQ